MLNVPAYFLGTQVRNPVTSPGLRQRTQDACSQRQQSCTNEEVGVRTLHFELASHEVKLKSYGGLEIHKSRYHPGHDTPAPLGIEAVIHDNPTRRRQPPQQSGTESTEAWGGAGVLGRAARYMHCPDRGTRCGQPPTRGSCHPQPSRPPESHVHGSLLGVPYSGDPRGIRGNGASTPAWAVSRGGIAHFRFQPWHKDLAQQAGNGGIRRRQRRS